MPELPDVELYVHALDRKAAGDRLDRVRVASPHLLRTWDPPLEEFEGKRVLGFRRLGKRIVFEMEDDLFLVLHLWIAGRLQWTSDSRAKLRSRSAVAAFDFSRGALVLTEAGTRHRASLHAVRGKEALAALDRGGIEVLDADLARFAAAIGRENRTLKRALCDPSLFAGIGNAYSDEILWTARLSPLQRTLQLSPEEVERLYAATQSTLRSWAKRLADEAGDEFPRKVTAFRPGMAVHGRYREPCPACGSPVQRIRYAENECNYCPKCQTGGKLLADRALSRLLRADWPRNLEELEELRRGGSP
jgi:formamidopyrimidine-DNA glycosylase